MRDRSTFVDNLPVTFQVSELNLGQRPMRSEHLEILSACLGKLSMRVALSHAVPGGTVRGRRAANFLGEISHYSRPASVAVEHQLSQWEPSINRTQVDTGCPIFHLRRDPLVSEETS